MDDLRPNLGRQGPLLRVINIIVALARIHTKRLRLRTWELVGTPRSTLNAPPFCPEFLRFFFLLFFVQTGPGT
jgi:hypothetical protein